jgi:hypothetical protein
MKTQTRAQILKIIEKNGKVRPSELCVSLKISPQAIHRHLRSLSEQGIVEAKGSAPFTQYALAGVPDFDAAFDWVHARTLDSNPQDHVSETRDNFTARLPRLKSHLKNGLPVNLLPLVISTSGEIGNNSFDHNLGQWRDVPGCWFEAQVSGRFLWICVGDRGQGVFQSLSRVHPSLTNDQSALEAAFEKIISGRSPEQRGNGLKFVRNSLSGAPGRGIACLSGKGKVHYGELGDQCAAILDKYFTTVKGTVTLMVWRLQ